MAWVSKDEEHARYTKMMSEELVPLMANLLGKKALIRRQRRATFMPRRATRCGY